MVSTTTGRRRFMTRSVKAAIAAWMAVLARGAADPASGFFGLFGKKKEGLQPGPDGSLKLNLKDEPYRDILEPGGAIKLSVQGHKRPLIIIRTAEQGVVALSSMCTHMGCEVDLPAEGYIDCPCHDSHFDLSGKAQSGPAKEPLQRFPSTVDIKENVVTISGLIGD
ncbi:MAG: Rieske 2Fe-2S domain-containing protein [Chitinivibrionales bacterium]|nr:Rieske 2Fe-2S domain-containing protein [Chitinivibrionales bacterium]MBD3395285.1 Rieske 2Fe-2S domain-containing protein [Chitinivibrionales bacterium]